MYAPVGAAPRRPAPPRPLQDPQTLADLTRAPQPSAFPLPLPEELQSLSQTAAPQLRPPPALWGVGGALRSRGRAGPATRGLTPKQLWGPGQAFVSLTHSLSWVEPKVRIYCTSRRILAGRANPDTSSVKGQEGSPGRCHGSFYNLVAEKVRAKLRDTLASRESAACLHLRPETSALGLHEPGRAPGGLSSAARRQVCPAKK